MSTRIPGRRIPDRRLFLGYGPGVFLATAFILMAVLVPTVAPQQNLSASAGTTAPPVGPSTGLPASGTSASTTSTTIAPGGATQTTVPNASSSPTPKSNGLVAGCSGKQVPGDPYSPPCISFSGSNGGSTSHGVTSGTITISYRIPSDAQSTSQAIEQIAGKYNSTAFSDTQAQTQQTLNDLVTYFNDKFQFYGRKLVLKTFNGTGSLTSELLDGGQSQADADAITAAQTVGAFADISGITQPYAEALSSQHVVNIGAPYMSAQWFAQEAPYAWSYYPNCTDLGNEGAAIAVKQLINQPVTWAGTGVKDGGARKFAVLAPDNPVYQQCASQVTSAMAAAGHPVAANFTYSLDLSQLEQEASSIEQQIVNDGITTVICGCDPITLIFLTGDLDNANYEPEWLNIGAAFTDEDLVAQLEDQSDWAHAAGVTNNGTVPPYGSSLGYFAVKSVDPNFAPAHGVDILYENLYLLALGIQLAGPDLTPTTFEKGLFSYGGGTGEYGPWSFQENGVGSFTPQHQFRYEWWDASATSAQDAQQGTWNVGTTWFLPSDIPKGPAPVFPNGPQ